MKKSIIVGLLMGAVIYSCDPDAKTYQEEDVVSDIVIDGDTPAQYEGSKGVIDNDDNDMDANENIQLKTQEFRGSFATPKTLVYELSVIKPDEYTFTLEADLPDIKYVVTKRGGENIIEPTRDTKTVMLQPGKYVITATIDLAEGEDIDPETEFTVYIK